MNSNTHNSQIFIQAPDLQIPIQTLTLTLNPNFSIHNLKQLFFKTVTYPLTLTSSSYFTLNGRTLPDNGTVKTTGIQGFETLTLKLRLYGGGGDGGSTCAESRDCYLNMYAEKKPDKVDPNEQRLSKWLNCGISNEALRKPVVVDYLGNLFNKESLVSALLEKKIPKAFSHIKRLRDVIDVEMEAIPGSSGDGSDRSDKDVKFQCPVTGLEFNGKYKFYALKSCGHVLSVKALREIKTNSCHVCHKEFVESDKIVINGNEEEVNALRESLNLNLREKKVKKVKNGGDGIEGVKLSGTKRGIELKAEKVNGKIETSGKGVKGVEVNGKSEGKRFKAVDVAPKNAKSDVYASIFTSSRKSEFKETYSCRSLPLGRN